MAKGIKLGIWISLGLHLLQKSIIIEYAYEGKTLPMLPQ